MFKRLSIFGSLVMALGCSSHPDPGAVFVVPPDGMAACSGLVAVDWDANDIPTDYYPNVEATDSTGVPNGTNGPWTIALSASNSYVEVAAPEGESPSIPPMQKGIDRDVTTAPGGGCELLFY